MFTQTESPQFWKPLFGMILRDSCLLILYLLSLDTAYHLFSTVLSSLQVFKDCLHSFTAALCPWVDAHSLLNQFSANEHSDYFQSFAITSCFTENSLVNIFSFFSRYNFCVNP